MICKEIRCKGFIRGSKINPLVLKTLAPGVVPHAGTKKISDQ